MHLYERAESFRCDFLFADRETLSRDLRLRMRPACYDHCDSPTGRYPARSEKRRRDDAPLLFRRIESGQSIRISSISRAHFIFRADHVCGRGAGANLARSSGESTSVTIRSVELLEMPRFRRGSEIQMPGLPHGNPGSAYAESRYARGLGGHARNEQRLRSVSL